MGPDQEDELDDSGDDLEDEEDERAIMDALLQTFAEVASDADPLVAQHALTNFAITTTHALLYDVVEFAEEEKLDVQRIAEEWLIDTARFFNAGLANEALLREIGSILGRPGLGVKFNGNSRRRLTGR